jgi:hypothetical protein
MKKILLYFPLFISLLACSTEKPAGEYPVIDVIGSIGKYQRVYMSDYFSSIELIPLETSRECLINIFPGILLNDSLIIMRGDNRIYAFCRSSGKFLNQIGSRGQGPGEHKLLGNWFFNTDNPTIFVSCFNDILEYDYSGRFIRSFRTPDVGGHRLSVNNAYVGDNLFVSASSHRGDNEFQYCLFDNTGAIVECFPNHIFFNTEHRGITTFHGVLPPFRIDNRLYLKDYINDTLYVLEHSKIQPAFVFDFGRYSFPIEVFVKPFPDFLPVKGAVFHYIMGMSNYIFYSVGFPESVSVPKAKLVPLSSSVGGGFMSVDHIVFGIYNIVQNKNILLDTDRHLQKGFVNDINGGLSFIPGFYAGNGEVVSAWSPEEMLEMLTEEYFATQTIKDPEAHQRLREVLAKLVEDDNPVVVIATLKE